VGERLTWDWTRPQAKKGGDSQVGRSATAALGALQFLVKKLREQRPWKVEKMSRSSMFRLLQLPKKLLRNEGENVVEKIQMFSFSNGTNLNSSLV
jgi:hypothetical protein